MGMITIVRPRAMRCRLALMRASLSGSSAEVASSRINSLGLTISARAIARCWRGLRRDPSSLPRSSFVTVRHTL